MKGEKEVELWEMFNVMNRKDANREVKNEEKTTPRYCPRGLFF